MLYQHRRYVRFAVVWGIALSGFLIYPAPTAFAPDPNLNPRNPPNWPSGLFTWNNSPVGSANDSVAGLTIRFLNQDVLLRATEVGTLTQPSSDETLKTLWMFTLDGDGINNSGVRADAFNIFQGLNNFVSPGQFMNAGVICELVGNDSQVNLDFTARGLNAEDFGPDSDATEAPDPGKYKAFLNLRMTYPVP